MKKIHETELIREVSLFPHRRGVLGLHRSFSPFTDDQHRKVGVAGSLLTKHESRKVEAQ